MKKILVIGAGSWGSAIANLLAKNSNEVFLVSRDEKITIEINENHTNDNFLPKVKLSENLTAIQNYDNEISNCDLVFIVVPSSACAEIFDKISKLQLKSNVGFVICSKGIEQKSLSFLGDAFEKIIIDKEYAVLSGPNFAIEVANEIPTITTIASKNKNLANEIIESLNNNYFKADYFLDPINVEICGIVKNIIAIGCGIVDGLDLGVNAKSALVIKGIEEIKVLCRELKVSEDISHSAGFGDIFLTCSSIKSRNNSLGVLISEGKNYQEIIEKTKTTYEGFYSAKAIVEIAKKLKIKLDLCDKINEFLNNKHTKSQIKEQISQIILK